MCRLLGWVARTPRTAREVLGEQGLASLRRLSRVHSDGWGLAADGAGAGDRAKGAQAGDQPADPILLRSPSQADTDPAFAAAMTVASRVGLVHLRWATAGLPVHLVNTHPFVLDGRAFAHNGALHPVERLGELLTPRWRARLRGSTDSEHYFLAVLAELEVPGTDVPTALDRVTARLARDFAPSSLNALLHTPEALYAVNCHNPAVAPGAAPEPRDLDATGPAGEAEIAAQEPYFDLRYRVTGDSVVIASSGFVAPQAAGWSLLAHDTLLTVHRDSLAVEQRPLTAQLGRSAAA